jgi:hypothetical protein
MDCNRFLNGRINRRKFHSASFVPDNASAESEARFREYVKAAGCSARVRFSRLDVALGLRRTRSLWKFNDGKERRGGSQRPSVRLHYATTGRAEARYGKKVRMKKRQQIGRTYTTAHLDSTQVVFRCLGYPKQGPPSRSVRGNHPTCGRW